MHAREECTSLELSALSAASKVRLASQNFRPRCSRTSRRWLALDQHGVTGRAVTRLTVKLTACSVIPTEAWFASGRPGLELKFMPAL